MLSNFIKFKMNFLKNNVFFITKKVLYTYSLFMNLTKIDTIIIGDIMTVDYNKIGIRIAQRRRELKMKQCYLAEKTNLSNNHISNIENGHSVPSLETLSKICEELEVTPDFLLLGNIKTNDIPKNIYDNLLLCNEKSLKIISQILEVILSNQE